MNTYVVIAKTEEEGWEDPTFSSPFKANSEDEAMTKMLAHLNNMGVGEVSIVTVYGPFKPVDSDGGVTFTFDNQEAHGIVRAVPEAYGLGIYIANVSIDNAVALVDLFGQPKALRLYDPRDGNGQVGSVFYDDDLGITLCHDDHNTGESHAMTVSYPPGGGCPTMNGKKVF